MGYCRIYLTFKDTFLWFKFEYFAHRKGSFKACRVGSGDRSFGASSRYKGLVAQCERNKFPVVSLRAWGRCDDSRYHESLNMNFLGTVWGRVLLLKRSDPKPQPPRGAVLAACNMSWRLGV